MQDYKATRFNEHLSPDLPVYTDEHARLLGQLRVVLVEPKTPGNIGATARALTVCGLSRLCLVNPTSWRDDEEAWTFAHGSHEVLNAAQEFDSLDAAVEGCDVVVATTHRMGRGRGPMVPAFQLRERIAAMLADGEVAVIFGREDGGLTNDELARCHMSVHIPTATVFPSLNLSHAAMVVLYEVFIGVLTAGETHDDGPPSYGAITALSERLAKLAERAGMEPLRGHTGLLRSLRTSLSKKGFTDRDFALAHLLCGQLEERLNELGG